MRSNQILYSKLNLPLHVSILRPVLFLVFDLSCSRSQTCLVLICRSTYARQIFSPTNESETVDCEARQHKRGDKKTVDCKTQNFLAQNKCLIEVKVKLTVYICRQHNSWLQFPVHVNSFSSIPYCRISEIVLKFKGIKNIQTSVKKVSNLPFVTYIECNRQKKRPSLAFQTT